MTMTEHVSLPCSYLSRAAQPCSQCPPYHELQAGTTALSTSEEHPWDSSETTQKCDFSFFFTLSWSNKHVPTYATIQCSHGCAGCCTAASHGVYHAKH